MTETTTPITPTTQIPGTTPPTQDLQINLAEATEQSEGITQGETQITEVQPSTWDLLPSTDLDLDLSLDLNLPEAPKNDNRLQTEDQKNNEAKTETIVEPIIEEAQVIEPVVEPVIEPVIEQVPVVEPVVEPVPVTEPVIEQVPITKDTEDLSVRRGNEGEVVEPTIEEVPVVEPVVEPVIEAPIVEQVPVVEQIIEQVPVVETTAEIKTSSEIVWENPLKSSDILWNSQPNSPDSSLTVVEEITQPEWEMLPTSSSLEADRKMIEELEWHASAGGLAPEAKTQPQSQNISEQPKTFDLDAMLGTTPPTTTPTPIATEGPLDIKGNQTEWSPASAGEGRFETPTPIQQTTQLPPMIWSPIIQTTPTIPTTTIQPKPNGWVKILLFVVLFMGLGFTTFFILKTMYPIEFSNLFGSDITTIQEIPAPVDMSWAIDMSWTVATGEEGIIDEMNDDIVTGIDTHESADNANFGELNDLTSSTPEDTIPNDISKLTEYATQGNNFLTQGKTLNNNTIIKYGLYISKKATSLLDDIANGKEINNLTGYFAQFDQYIAQLQKLLTTQTPVSAATTTTNGFEETPDTNQTTTPFTGQ